MGGLCSKPTTVEGGHTVVRPMRTLGGDGGGGKDNTPPRANNREAALAAAEKRKQDEQRRGTSALNPNAGKLSSQLAAKNRNKSAEPKQPERLVWD